MKFVLAAIVATMLLPPLAGLAWLGCALVDRSFGGLVTFGGALAAPAGVLAWWLILFVPALAYAILIRHGQGL